MLNLGLCNEEQGKIATALKWFRKAQARGSEMNLRETETAAKEHTAALAARVPTAKLVFHTSPRLTPRVLLDGDKLEPTSFARVEVDPGHHEIVVTTLEGTTTQGFDIGAGQAKTLTLDVPAPPAPKTRVVEVDAGKDRRHHALWIGAASAGLGVAVLGWATYEKIHTDQQGLPPQSYVDAKNDLRRYGTIAGGLSIAGLGVATWMYLTAPNVQRREEIVPVVAPDHVGFAFTKDW